MTISNGDPIDGNTINSLSTKVDNIKDKLINLMWKNAKGDNDKVIKALDGKGLMVLAGAVPVKDSRAKSDETSIDVKFYRAFGGSKDPVVVAMPESKSPYGVSIKKVNREGFTLVIHHFTSDDDNLDLTAINYIAVGQD